MGAKDANSAARNAAKLEKVSLAALMASSDVHSCMRKSKCYNQDHVAQQKDFSKKYIALSGTPGAEKQRKKLWTDLEAQRAAFIASDAYKDQVACQMRKCARATQVYIKAKRDTIAVTMATLSTAEEKRVGSALLKKLDEVGGMRAADIHASDMDQINRLTEKLVNLHMAKPRR